MKLFYGGGLLDGQRITAKDRLTVALGQESIDFYVYFPLSRCSQARVDQVKKGVSLAEVAESQAAVIKSALALPVRAPPRRERLLQHTSLSPTATPRYSDAGYSLTPRGDVSAAMREYIASPSFDREMEKKKHENLKTYFQVRFT